MRLRWRGKRRDGVNCGGMVGGQTACELTESLYRRRYRDVVVTDEDGDEVGAIWKHDDTGNRVWYAASDTPTETRDTGTAPLL